MVWYLWCAAAAVTLSSVACACGPTIDVGTNNPASDAGPNAAADTSASPASRSEVCALAIDKKCTYEDQQACERGIAGMTSASYVAALARCLTASPPCTDTGPIPAECLAKASSEVAPGFPNIPSITRCLDKDTACNAGLSYLCRRIPRLDAAGKSRVEECRAMDCPAFAPCLRGAASSAGE